MEERDLGVVGGSLNKKKRLPLWILLAILFVVAMVWGVSFMTSLETGEKERISDIDTTYTEIELPSDSTSKVINEPESPEKKKEAVSNKTAEKPENHPIEAATVEIQLLVDALWKDSEIRVNGKAVAPLNRLGTLITLALPPGSHEIQLISRGDRCLKRILVREKGQRIPITCD